MTSEPVFDTGLGTYAVDTHLLAGIVDVLNTCAQACATCADLCVIEGRHGRETCIRRCLATFEVCRATAAVVARQGSVPVAVERHLVEACIAFCETCEEECTRHDRDHCIACADACRRCISACRSWLTSVDEV
jgi:hypothetical protein